MTRSRQKALSKLSSERATTSVLSLSSATVTVSAWSTWVSALNVKWKPQPEFLKSIKVDGVYGTISNSSN